MLKESNWASLCMLAQEAASFQQWDGVAVVDNVEVNCDFEIVESNAETYEQLKRFLNNWRARTKEKAIIKIAGGGGSVYYAKIMCNLIADSIEYVSLTWGQRPICSAGHNYWYDPRFRSAWINGAALLQLHSCTSGNNSDLRFYSLNVSAMNNQHSSDAYTYVLSMDTNFDRDPWFGDPTMRLYFSRIVRNVMNQLNYRGVGEVIDYVEMFAANTDGNITSEVLPARPMCIDHRLKLVEELFEFNSAKEGTQERIFEGFDLVHTVLCALSSHSDLYFGNIMCYHSSNREGRQTTLHEEVDIAICKLAHELAQYSGWNIAGLVRNWEKSAIRRDRPVPVVSMLEFINATYEAGNSFQPIEHFIHDNNPTKFELHAASLLFSIDDLHTIDEEFSTNDHC